MLCKKNWFISKLGASTTLTLLYFCDTLINVTITHMSRHSKSICPPRKCSTPWRSWVPMNRCWRTFSSRISQIYPWPSHTAHCFGGILSSWLPRILPKPRAQIPCRVAAKCPCMSFFWSLIDIIPFDKHALQEVLSKYRVFEQLAGLGWVDLDLGCSIILPVCSTISAKIQSA